MTMEAEDKLNMVRDWIDDGEAPESFDDSFISSLEDAFDEFGDLTERQEDALDNIIRGYRIGKSK